MQLREQIVSTSVAVGTASFALLAIDAMSEWAFPSFVTIALAHGVALGLAVSTVRAGSSRRR